MWRTALSVAASIIVASAQELPISDGGSALEIEPPLLIKDGKPLPRAEGESPVKSVDELVAALDRARKVASTAERQFRVGIISKAQSEERALRVVRLEAEVANAQLAQAKAANEANGSATDETAAAVAKAEEAARVANVNRDRAEIAAARANLERQQKLLALGSGRRADVERAAAKLSELTQTKE